MVIPSEFRMWQYGDDDHREDLFFSKTHLKLSTDSDLVLKLDDENEIAGLEVRIAKFNFTINSGGNVYAGEALPL